MLYSEYKKKTLFISINTVISVVVNIGLNYWLIPIFGYTAAAYTTAFSYILLFTLHYITTKLIMKENTIQFKKFVPGLLLFFVFVGLHLVIDQSVSILFIKTILKIVLLAAFAYLLFRKT